MGITEKVIEKMYEYGASQVARIDGKDVPYEVSFRDLCVQNSCGRYGKSYGCPPYIGEAKDMITEAQSYNKAIVYQTIYELEDSYDIEGMLESGIIHNEIAKKIKTICKEDKVEEFIVMGCGSCDKCSRCACLDNKPCYFPEEIMASTDSYCVYVSELAKRCDMKYVNGQNTVTYFGMLLLRG